MKIIRAQVINLLFSIGASIAPRTNEIYKWDWMNEEPHFLTSDDGGVWVSDKDDTWEEDNVVQIGHQGRPLFRIEAASEKNQFDNYINVSGNERVCVLKRHNNDCIIYSSSNYT
jgi:hypothetical protein